MKIFIILSKSSQTHDSVNALGHEIHITRYILYDLLQKNIIDKNVNIVTISKDRFFLYNNIFTNVHEWNDYKKIMNENNIKEIDLTRYSSGLDMHNSLKDGLKKDFNCEFYNFEITSKFIDYINNINLINLNECEKYKLVIKNDFTVVHFRFEMLNNSSGVQNSFKNLLKIIDKIREYTDNVIVIFCSKLPNDIIQKNLVKCKNIVIIDNLQHYASFLSNTKCKLLISEWSGGGQLSQYCFDGKIIYYFDYYPSNDYELRFYDYQNYANLPNNIFSCWDFKTTKKNEREYYKTLDLMISNLSKNFNN